jgi:transposase
MEISHCRLSKSTQTRLLEYFVLEVTAKSAANLLGIQANSAILFYRKIRQEIAKKSAIEAQEIFKR